MLKFQRDSSAYLECKLKMLEVAKELPDKPGVYFFKDEKDEILYIGKAINLRKRVISYFRNSKQKEFITVKDESPRRMRPLVHTYDYTLQNSQELRKLIYNKEVKKLKTIKKNVTKIDYIITDSDDEAFTLEGCLISAFRPRINRAVSRYPFIEITIGEKIPRVLTNYQSLLPDSYIFGPFNVASDLDLAMEGFLTVIPICNSLIEVRPEKKYPSSCIRLHVSRCLSPCDNGKDCGESYTHFTRQFILELETKGRGVIKKLTRLMENEIEDENFEGAAILRDRIQAINKAFEAKAMPTILGKFYQQLKEIIGEKYQYKEILERILENNSN